MPKNKYYACKNRDGTDGRVFDNWEECKEYINGKNVQYKGFKTKPEAEEYAGLQVSLPLPELDTTPIKNPAQEYTHAQPCMSVDDYCQKYDFNNFTKEQRAAIQTVDGKALLFAVPGSGKTTVIMARTGYLVHACNINPGEIVTLTFTRAAAEEMEDRYYTKFPADRGLVNFRTIHSFCWRVILPELRAAGFNYPEKLIGGSNQFVNDNEEVTQIKIIKQVLRECCGYSKSNDEAAQNKVINAITGVKNNVNLPEDLGTITINKNPIKVHTVYCYYQKLLEEKNALDFDDMLRYSYKGLREHPKVLFSLQERFKYWSIDESQDNSELQYELLKLLVGEKGNLFMVGDDDQSIYSFRAAKPSLMVERFGAQSDTQTLHMSTNFRSDTSIIRASESLIGMNGNREPKKMKPRLDASEGKFNIGIDFLNEQAEYEYIIKEALESIKNNQSLGILYRLHTSSLPIITHLHKNHIPYKASKSIAEVLSGLTISRVLSFLKCSQKQTDFKTVYNNFSKLGIYLDKEKYSQETLKTACEEHPDKTVLDNVLSLLAPESKNVETVASCNDLLKEIADKKPGEAVSTIFAKMSILDNDTISDRLKGYAVLSSAELFDTIDDFLSAIKEIKANEKHVASPQNSDLNENDESVCTSDKPLVFLSSIHSAKGKQYDRVMLVDCFDEMMPGRPQPDNINYDPEEERRLFYVAVTRAKHRLDILTVDRYHGNLEPTSKYVFDLALICKKLGIPTQHDEKEIIKDSMPLVFAKKKGADDKPNDANSEEKRPVKIFISYSSKERNIADKVKQALESHGVSCWMDLKSIAPGNDYTKDIPPAIRSADAVVLILSKAAQESEWVPGEMEIAIKRKVMIIPLQIDDEPLTDQFDFLIGRKQRIDAYHRLSDALEELVGRVTTL